MLDETAAYLLVEVIARIWIVHGINLPIDHLIK
jgi:hypothetical protein